MGCTHAFAEQETLLADGYCVECLITRARKVERERDILEEGRALLNRQVEQMRWERDEARAEIERLRGVLHDCLEADEMDQVMFSGGSLGPALVAAAKAALGGGEGE